MALSCYSCTALTSAACNETHIIETCNDQYPLCLTMTYTSKYDDGERNYFVKKCRNNDRMCEQNCDSIKGAYNCKVSEI